MSMVHSLSEKLKDLHEALQLVEQRYHRTPGSVKLVAVSKGQKADILDAAIRAGQRVFAENYVQEAQKKIEALKAEKIEWHFIGRIQKNKTKFLAEKFDWVHSVDRLVIAEQLSRLRSKEQLPLQVCIQVNVTGSQNKAGVSLEALPELALEVARLPQLTLRGLMTIAEEEEDSLAAFKLLHTKYQSLCASGFTLDTLSMGMSEDWESAVAAGATMIRLGSAIFGPRESHTKRSVT